MNADRTGSLLGLYGRLKGIRELLAQQTYVPKFVGDDYNQIVDRISQILGDDWTSFKLPPKFWYTSARDNADISYSYVIQAKLFQLMSHLEFKYRLQSEVMEIGSIYNSIKDEELKSRCSDILSAPGNFDRVINQATLVLEDRIRKKSQLNDQVGVQLVNKAFNTDLKKSVLQISDDQEEHEGISHICRGVVLSFRNPTHHKITETYSREDALKFCAFVDILLAIIDKSKRNPNL